MKFLFVAICLMSVLAPASTEAKKPPVLSGLELQQIQARDMDTTKDLAFAAVMTVLQDGGYRIGSADRDTGLITGTASTAGHMVYSLWSGFGKSKKTPIVSAYIEARGPTSSRIRLNFVMAKVRSTIYSSGSQDEEPILDPAIYQAAFEKINQAIFVRQATDSPSPVSTSTAASAAPVQEAPSQHPETPLSATAPNPASAATSDPHWKLETPRNR